jgi:hypothetical protein
MRDEATAVKLKEAKELYPNEWIAFRATQDGENPEGDVLLHNKDRDVFDQGLLELDADEIYIVFAGPPIPEGYGFLFWPGTS